MIGKYSYGRKQLIALISVIILVPALRIYPAGAVDTAGHSVWLSSLAAIPVLLVYILFLSKLYAYCKENQGLSELSLQVMGNSLGKFYLILLSIWLLVYAGFILRSGADRLITTVYPHSSHYVFTIVLGLAAGIAALSSGRSIVRVAKMVVPIVFGVLLLILFTAIFSVDFSNLLPVRWEDFMPVMSGSAAVIDVISVGLYLSCFFAYSCEKGPNMFRDYSVTAVILCLILSLMCVCIVGSFGAELTARLTRPFFSLVRNLVFFGSLQRVEALVVSLWIFPDFLLVSCLLYTVQHNLRLIAGSDRTNYYGKSMFDLSSGRWILLPCAAGAIIAGIYIAPDPVSLDFWSLKLVPVVNLTVAYAFVPLIYIVGKLRKKL